jgi:hypothetical protein
MRFRAFLDAACYAIAVSRNSLELVPVNCSVNSYARVCVLLRQAFRVRGRTVEKEKRGGRKVGGWPGGSHVLVDSANPIAACRKIVVGADV